MNHKEIETVVEALDSLTIGMLFSDIRADANHIIRLRAVSPTTEAIDEAVRRIINNIDYLYTALNAMGYFPKSVIHPDPDKRNN